MEHQKILTLLNEPRDSKSVTRKWNIVGHQSNGNYDQGNEIIFNTEVLKSKLCDYDDPYILERVDIITIAHNNTPVAFKSCASFPKCIAKIDGTTRDDAEDFDLNMLMYNLIEYSSNYGDTTGSLWFCYKDEAANLNAIFVNTNT